MRISRSSKHQSLPLRYVIVRCRKEKANIDLCCCGLKVNEADRVSHSHPATQQLGTTGATTKPAGIF